MRFTDRAPQIVSLARVFRRAAEFVAVPGNLRKIGVGSGEVRIKLKRMLEIGESSRISFRVFHLPCHSEGLESVKRPGGHLPVADWGRMPLYRAKRFPQFASQADGCCVQRFEDGLLAFGTLLNLRQNITGFAVYCPYSDDILVSQWCDRPGQHGLADGP
jgi:hypothetical protein